MSTTICRVAGVQVSTHVGPVDGNLERRRIQLTFNSSACTLTIHDAKTLAFVLNILSSNFEPEFITKSLNNLPGVLTDRRD
jgi:hypothetical protein